MASMAVSLDGRRLADKAVRRPSRRTAMRGQSIRGQRALGMDNIRLLRSISEMPGLKPAFAGRLSRNKPAFSPRACCMRCWRSRAAGACLKRKKIRNLEGISRWFSRRIRSAKMAQKTLKLRSREFSNTPQSATPWFFAAGLEKRPQICYNHLYARKMSKRRYKACRKTAGGSESFTAN